MSEPLELLPVPPGIALDAFHPCPSWHLVNIGLPMSRLPTHPTVRSMRTTTTPALFTAWHRGDLTMLWPKAEVTRTFTTTVSFDSISPAVGRCEGAVELRLQGESDPAPHNLQRQVRVFHAQPFQPRDPGSGPHPAVACLPSCCPH